MEIGDLADVFHLGERIFTSKFVNLYRIWSEWEVTDLYNSDPGMCPHLWDSWRARGFCVFFFSQSLPLCLYRLRPICFASSLLMLNNYLRTLSLSPF